MNQQIEITTNENYYSLMASMAKSIMLNLTQDRESKMVDRQLAKQWIEALEKKTIPQYAEAMFIVKIEKK